MMKRSSRHCRPTKLSSQVRTERKPNVYFSRRPSLSWSCLHAAFSTFGIIWPRSRWGSICTHINRHGNWERLPLKWTPSQVIAPNLNHTNEFREISPGNMTYTSIYKHHKNGIKSCTTTNFPCPQTVAMNRGNNAETPSIDSFRYYFVLVQRPNPIYRLLKLEVEQNAFGCHFCNII